ncbi:hypothetical protein ACQUY5_16535 [Bacillus cereus]|uniref:hypothetical protein n=1 Tax=Bacillus cereus TaxID=1396 RepID=UPI003D1830B0
MMLLGQNVYILPLEPKYYDTATYIFEKIKEYLLNIVNGKEIVHFDCKPLVEINGFCQLPRVNSIHIELKEEDTITFTFYRENSIEGREITLNPSDKIDLVFIVISST